MSVKLRTKLILSTTLGIVALAALALSRPIATSPAQQQGEATPGSPRKDSGNQKAESKLIVAKAAAPTGNLLSFPLHFRAAPGETVGTIRAQVTIPDGPWKFRKASSAPGSRLRVSARQVKQNDKQRGEGGAPSTTLDLTISAGSRSIRDGWVASLEFMLTEPGNPGPASLIAAVVETAPPKVEQIVDAPADNPPPPAAGPELNPAVGCFFFSH